MDDPADGQAFAATLLAALAPLFNACASAPPDEAAPCSFPGERAPGSRAGRVAVPRATLHYEVEGSGPTLVLVHGSADHRLFHPVLGRLADRFRVVYYDQRGYGLTTSDADERPALEDDVADLEALRVELGVESVHLLAMSNGGPIAIDYALANPTRVRRLVLLDTYADNNARIALAYPLVREVLADEGREAAVEAIEARRSRDPLQRDIDAFLVTPHTHHESALPREWVEYWFRSGCMTDVGPRPWRSPRDYARLDDLARLDVPTLVVCGAKDRVTPLEHSRDMESRLPHGRLVVLEGAGHLAFAERPDEFARIVHEFLLGEADGPITQGEEPR